MKKYLAFFRLRFVMGLQYRAAAFAGVVTQFFWGAMSIFTYKAFYESNPAAFPMAFEATATYIWLQQAFMALFVAWMVEYEIFDSIVGGSIAYELCRPISIYNMWFVRSAANRLSRAVLRCLPILIVAAFLPKPYGLGAPADFLHFVLFAVTMIFGFMVTVAFCMFVYGVSFFTVSPQGVRIVFVCSVELLAGQIIPLPFFPSGVQKVLELLPFAAMENVPLRIYSGSMDSKEMIKAIVLQIVWLAAIVIAGRLLCGRGEKKAVIQGG